MFEAVPDFPTIDENFRPKIRRYLTRLVGEEQSEDLTQEVFLKVSRGLPAFRGESNLSTWIYRIATNAAVDHIRSRASQPESMDDLPDDSDLSDEWGTANQNIWTGEPTPSPEQTLMRQTMNRCIRDFIEGLPSMYRTVLVLSDMEGFTNHEIADVLGITLGTAKIRLHRARYELKRQLEAHCGSEWIEGNEFLPDLKRALAAFPNPE